jgi:cytoskeletal protein CcmA (bactofilin family)
MFAKDEKQQNSEPSNISNIIGKETTLEGSLSSSGNIRVEGKVNGDVVAKAKFVLGIEAVVTGNVVARTADIAGKIEGNIEVSEVLTLKPSAVINGDILTNKLVVEPGASFNGGCRMGHLAKEIDIEVPESVV